MYVRVKIQKNIVCTKKYIWNNTTCSYGNGKYVRSIIDGSMISCVEAIEEKKTIPRKTVLTKTVPTKSTFTKTVLPKCTLTNFYILLAFLLITIALLIAVSIYCYWIKYRAK